MHPKDIDKDLAAMCLPELVKLWKALQAEDAALCLYEPIYKALEKLNARAARLKP